MTEERSHPDTDGVTDPLVSRTYRESAQERVPDALDRAVLQQARQNAGNRYSRSVIWLRPAPRKRLQTSRPSTSQSTCWW